MASETRTTTDHDEIRRWVKQHDGSPAVVRATGSRSLLGVLRFGFLGGTGEDKLEHIDWEECFDTFDTNNLALLYQEQKSSDEDSTNLSQARSRKPNHPLPTVLLAAEWAVGMDLCCPRLRHPGHYLIFIQPAAAVFRDAQVTLLG
jgi:hypothetical protein